MFRQNGEGGAQVSAADIPYQLRPNKFIDRQLFVELLARLAGVRGLEKYLYVSMGGRHLVDFYAVYKRLGIDALYSFDRDENEVRRQRFNRPTGKTICEKLNSADLPAKLDDIASKFPRKENFIVWLDYTDARRRTQFQEVVETLQRLKHGDILRLTMNASGSSVSSGDAWRAAGAAGPNQYRAAQLKEQIQEFMPTDITSVSEAEFADVLVRCVELAVNLVETQRDGLHVTPVLITSYKDGQPMITVTCAVSEETAEEEFPPVNFARWRFACRGWRDIRWIYAPVLSAKEQTRLDSCLHRGPQRMLASLKFLPAKDDAQSLEALRSYRTFQRYYPAFRHVVE
jgi:hypothetical protein